MKPKLKFMLDYGTNPLWSNDEFTSQKFGYHIDRLEDLGLSAKTIELSKIVTSLYWDRLNPIYQMLPSFWSGEMHLFFQRKLKELFELVVDEIGNDYEIENKEEQEINTTIDTQNIDIEVNEFLKNPNSFYRRNGIKFNKTDDEEKRYVALEYEKWMKIESEILNK
ncbi:hypothetical protein ACFQ1R_13075 [Mariniflexile jejuense]|uniref:Uncharacterized protein n=1 Tax=Mariniflexile jejuense TaxID=1173582 RepID=A0ABW3JM88_9FLAO